MFFMPCLPGPADPSQLPSHPSLRLAAHAQQPLSTRYGRLLLTYVKDAAFDTGVAAAWAAAAADMVYDVERLAEVVFAQMPPAQADKNGSTDASGTIKQRFRGKMV